MEQCEVSSKKQTRLLTRRPPFDRSALQSKSWLNSIKATSNATWSTSVPPFGTLRAKLTISIAVEPPGVCWALVRVLSAAERTVRHVASLYMFGRKKKVLFGRGRNLYVSCVAGLIEVMKLYAFLESALL